MGDYLYICAYVYLHAKCCNPKKNKVVTYLLTNAYICVDHKKNALLFPGIKPCETDIAIITILPVKNLSQMLRQTVLNQCLNCVLTFLLRCVGMPPYFSNILSKGANFCDFCLLP